ncbi:hypothetical protein AVEN_9691-1 [Araneus ventricosus]|uniref:Uncharacterized protein n=1 Tax=Araneus ventricosus TaxID=182803 RepID=A0A4Y2DY54_ARAVE|nr:hypothetical protein AVEN_9691-1 [Araneus ventricosus]
MHHAEKLQPIASHTFEGVESEATGSAELLQFFDGHRLWRLPVVVITQERGTCCTPRNSTHVTARYPKS